jgi:hypothetical protein
VINQIPADLRAAYLAFRRERRPDDALTPHTRAFPALRDTQMGLNAELSRHVRAADGTTAHLVPGEGVLAIILGLFQALDGTGIGTRFRGTGRLQIVGLLPDGVHTVTVVRRNGDEIDVKVPDHLYAADVQATSPEELPAVVRFDLGGQERELRVPGADDEIISLRSPWQ